MPKTQHLLKSIGKGGNTDQDYAASACGPDNHLLTGLGNRGELLLHLMIVRIHVLPSLNIEKGDIGSIGGHDDQLRKGAILHGSDLDVLLQVYGPNHLERLLGLPAYANLVIQGATDEHIDPRLYVLGGNDVRDLTAVPGQGLHLGAVGRVVESDVALAVTDDHSLLQEVEVECGDLE